MEDKVMDMIVSRAQGAVPVTVLSLRGNLDRFSYQDLVNKSREIYESGHSSSRTEISF